MASCACHPELVPSWNRQDLGLREGLLISTQAVVAIPFPLMKRNQKSRQNQSSQPQGPTRDFVGFAVPAIGECAFHCRRQCRI